MQHPEPRRLFGGWGVVSSRRSRLFERKWPLPASFGSPLGLAPEATGERLASDSDQSDVYVCPAKERADMKRSNPTRSGTKTLTDELAELRALDPTALKQRWRALYRTEAPVHIGQALVLQAVAYQLQ